jgi:hypothetical protein
LKNLKGGFPQCSVITVFLQKGGYDLKILCSGKVIEVFHGEPRKNYIACLQR